MCSPYGALCLDVFCIDVRKILHEIIGSIVLKDCKFPQILKKYEEKFGTYSKIAKTVLTVKKDGAKLADNKGNGALRRILKALFPLYESFMGTWRADLPAA